MIHIGLFEGIGGFSLAAQAVGWETVNTCEINPFGQWVLQPFLPDAYHHGDIKTLNYDTINVQLIQRFGANWRNDDIIVTGGFPCQPYSLAGKLKGKDDDRHLWPEMLRVIQEIKPTWVVGENVPGLINWSKGMVFDEVQADLETEGYEVIPFVLPAAGVNAPHKRYRVWFVAYSASYTDNARLQGCEKRRSTRSSRSEQKQQPSRHFCTNWQNFPTQSAVRSGNDGISTELVRARIREDSMGLLSEKEIDKIISKATTKYVKKSIKAYGNAIVHQVAVQIFTAINEFMEKTFENNC